MLSTEKARLEPVQLLEGYDQATVAWQLNTRTLKTLARNSSLDGGLITAEASATGGAVLTLMVVRFGQVSLGIF